MWFNILTHNHYDMDTIESLSPVIDYVRNTLSLCGHEVSVVYDQIYPEAVNLYLEHFVNGKEFAQRFRVLRRDHGVRIGVIATELMIDGAIPYGRHGISHPDPNYVQQRMTGLHAVLPEVDFMWSLLERTAVNYRKRVPISEFFPVGHAETGMTADIRRSPKDLDLVFFGKFTPHRKRCLQAIVTANVKSVIMGVGFPMGWQAKPLAASLLDRARIGLNLTLHSEEESSGGIDPRFVSCLRVVDMLARDTLVVSEEIPLDNPYGPYMVSAPVADLPAVCRKLIDDGSWAGLAKSNAAAFRSAMDVRTLCAPVIERTLAALNRPRPGKGKRK
jgi:hypothetical protein